LLLLQLIFPEKWVPNPSGVPRVTAQGEDWT
jgi:hypothetical protein